MSMRDRLLTGTSVPFRSLALTAPLFAGQSIVEFVVNGRQLDLGEHTIARSGSTETVTFTVIGRAEA